MNIKNRKSKTFIYLTIVVFGIFALVSVLYKLGVFTFIENKTYDARMVYTASAFMPSDDICFIGIDQDSLNRAQEERGWSWPWPREAYGMIADYLHAGNAKSLTFDVLFTEPSVYGNADDEAFAKACKDWGKVVNTMYHSATAGAEVLLPIQSIKESAALIGSTVSAKDSDDMIRRARLYYEANGEKYAALGLAPLLLEEENSSLPTDDCIDGYESSLPLDKDGTLLLRYKGSIDRYAHYSAYDIIKSYDAYLKGEEAEIPPDNFEDAFVYFIFYAPGLFDICATPISKVYPGAGVHITLLDGILNNSFITPLPEIAVYVYMFICALLAMLCVRGANAASKRGLLLIVLSLILFPAAMCVLSVFLFSKNIWIPVVAPLLCYVLSIFGSIIVSYGLEGKQKQFIKNAFSQYLSPAVIDSLIANPHNLKLGGEKRHISIFFSDVQSFTSLSEKLTPEKLTELLNQYLTEMTNIILASGGTIDKYEGDAIIAFWNAPSNQENHAQRAIEAAIECQARLEELSAEFTKKVGRPLWTRIGINTGDAIVGNMGSNLRFDYTMLGDSVNLASRLEGLNKQFGTYLMCSLQTKTEAVKAGCALKWRELGKVAVVGKKEAVTVFEPITQAVYKKKEKVYKGFSFALKLFYQGKFLEAKKYFDVLSRYDPPSRSYSERCALLLQEGVDSKNWNGVWVASSK